MENSKKIVWVNGTFDVVHIGHIKLLEFAKSLGDFLVVGIDRDDRVRQKKGPSRPVNPDWARMMMIKAIKPVDKVVTFDSDESLRDWIRTFKVDVIVVGEEYQDKEVIGSELVNETVYFEKVGEFSTTKILSKK